MNGKSNEKGMKWKLAGKAGWTSGLTNEQGRAVVDRFLNLLAEQLSQGKTVTLYGFGEFRVQVLKTKKFTIPGGKYCPGQKFSGVTTPVRVKFLLSPKLQETESWKQLVRSASTSNDSKPVCPPIGV